MIELLRFILFIFFFIFLPGLLIIRKTKIKLGRSEEIFISLGMGIAILTFTSFISGSIGLRFLLFPLLILADLYLLIFEYHLRPLRFKKLKINWPVVFLISSAVIFQNLVMIKSGTSYQDGLAFWGVHGHDGIWHLTLIQELAKNFPAQNPAFAGEKLKNYHYFFDLLGAEIFRITKISLVNLYFRWLPLFLSLITNVLVFFFTKRWSGKRRVGLIAVFLTAFASSFGYLLPLLGVGSDNWETAFWAMQPASSLQNPPFAISLLFLTLGMDLLLLFFNQKKESRLLGMTLILVFGILIEFKVYAGFLALLALGMAGIFRFFKSRDFSLLRIFLGGLILGLLLYFSQNKVGVGYFIWQPFWFIRTMIQAPDRVNWVSLELRRQIYTAYHNRMGILAIDFLSLAIFLLGNLGTRILGIGWVFSNRRKIEVIEIFMATVFLVGMIIPLLFLQKFVVWNSIQFLYYPIFVASFFAALVIDGLFERFKKATYFMAILLIVLSIPASLKTISWHLGSVPTTVLDKSEKSALEFLRQRKQLDGKVVLVYPFDRWTKDKIEPPVSLSYYNTAYVSFFSNKPVYLEDETAALIQDYDFESRIARERQFFSEKNSDLAYQFLTKNNIGYIYLVDSQEWQADLETQVKEIFKNERVRIFEVKD